VKNLLFALVILAAVSMVVTATPLCTDPSVIGKDVTTIPACMLGGLTFSNFQVSGVPNPPGSTVSLSLLAGTGMPSPTEFDLGFQITTGLGTGTPPSQQADTILEYTVSGSGIIGVDNSYQYAGALAIQETVCSVAFVKGVCAPGNTLASFINPPTTGATFAPQSTIYILKDIQQNAPTAFISSFVNSQETNIPEPATFGMLGGGLILVAFARRKRA